MSRVQLSINVSDLDAAVSFYSRLFGVGPAKLRAGYANFAVDDPPLKLVINSPENGPGGTINHLGVEVGSTEEVDQADTRLTAAGVTTVPNPVPPAATPAKTRPGLTTPTVCPGSTTPSLSTSKRREPSGAVRREASVPAGESREDATTDARPAGPAASPSDEWLRLARRARALSWLTLGWLGVEAAVAIGAALVAGSTALLGFGLDSGIEALASIIVVWRFTGTRLGSALSERRAQKLVAVSFFLLAAYIAVEAAQALAAGTRAETSIVGIVLTAGTALLEPPLGIAKRRLGARLGSAATAGEGTQNMLCAYLALAVLIGLLANTLLRLWWLDGVVAIGIAGWAVVEGRRAWSGMTCACAAPACDSFR